MQSVQDTGVLSWVTSGRCDLVADIHFPRDASELDLSAIVADIVDKFDKEIGAHLHVGPQDKGKRIPGQRVLSRDALEVPKGWGGEEENAKGRKKAAAAAVASAKGKEEVVEGMEEDVEAEGEGEKKSVVIDLDIRFKDLKASVPVSFFGYWIRCSCSY